MSKEEFKLYADVKTYDLDKLLKLGNMMRLMEDKSFQVSWKYVSDWTRRPHRTAV